MAAKASRTREKLRPHGPIVSIIMGSKSDWETMQAASEMLTGIRRRAA